jgi:DNA adenine methylase
MQYFGGKHRIAPKLAAFMQPFVRDIYIEPFVGGASVMAAMTAPIRIGADVNCALITMWRALADGWLPPKVISETEYAAVRTLANLNDPLTAFVAFGCSFGGKWFGGYARDVNGSNYAARSGRTLAKKMINLKGVNWECSDYRALEYPPGSCVYCDPPYKDTTGFAGTGKFNTPAFWDFYRDKAKSCRVFISEYVAPPDFE